MATNDSLAQLALVRHWIEDRETELAKISELPLCTLNWFGENIKAHRGRDLKGGRVAVFVLNQDMSEQMRARFSYQPVHHVLIRVDARLISEAQS